MASTLPTVASSAKISPSTCYRIAGLVYALTAFAGTFVFFGAFVIFLGNLPKREAPWLSPSADVGAAGGVTGALLWNAALLTLFCLQHSLMARSGIKKYIERVLPAPLERATYVHAANLAGFLFMLLWQPVPIVLWKVESDVVQAALWLAFGSGWLLLFLAAISIDIFELLGLRQAWHWFLRRPAGRLTLQRTWVYRYLEHPMYVGVIAGFWMTPFMTLGHAALAAHFTLYIAIAMQLERRDLASRFGADYAAWRKGQDDRRQPTLPAFTRDIAAELAKRYMPTKPMTHEMATLLERL